MGDNETNKWLKTQMIESSQRQAAMLEKLDHGEGRMTKIEENLDTVMEATREFPALKIDVDVLKRVEEERKAKKLKDLEDQLAAQKAESKATKAMWRGRAWDVFKALIPYIVAGAAFIYTQIPK